MNTSNAIFLAVSLGLLAARPLAAQLSPAATAPAPIFGTGLIPPSPAELSKAQVEIPRTFGAPPLPPFFSLRSELPPPANQGQSNSCVGWAVEYGLLSFLKREVSPRDAFFVYYWALVTEKDDAQPGPLTDKGCKFETAFEILATRGACSSGAYRNFAGQPSSELVRDARSYVVPVKSSFIFGRQEDGGTTGTIYTIKKELAARKPLPAGFELIEDFSAKAGFNHSEAGSGFEARSTHDGKRVRVWKGAPEGLAGIYHAMLIIGYDDAAHAFEVMNSYGADFGNGGYTWIDYDFLKKCGVCVFTFTQSTEQLERVYGSVAAVREGVANGQIESYVRIAQKIGDARNVENLNFELPEGTSVENLKQGETLSLPRDIAKVTLRGGISDYTQNGTAVMDKPVGAVETGDRFRVTELKKVIVDGGARVDYWAKGVVEK